MLFGGEHSWNPQDIVLHGVLTGGGGPTFKSWALLTSPEQLNLET